MSNIQDKPETPYVPSTIENIDLAVYKWLDEKLNLHSDTNKGWSKTPVIWVSGERSWQVKNKKELRDSNDNFILPVITLERTDMSKEKDKKGKYWGDVIPFNDEKGGSIPIYREIKQDKTSNHANTDSKRLTGQPNFKRENKKIIYETKYIQMPVYVTMTYVINVRTEYQQQMNDLLQPFMTFTGAVNYFIVENEGHRYETFVEPSFATENNTADLQQNERNFNSKITLKVLGHLTSKGKNDDKPYVSTRENIVDVKIPREYVIFGEDEDKIKLW